MIYTIITTSDSVEVLKKMAKILIDEGLSPCAQISQEIESMYLWDNKIEKNKEFLLTIKTVKSNIDEINIIISDNHNYEVPEVIVNKTKIINNDYENWFNQNITRG